MPSPPGHGLAPGGLYSLDHTHSLGERDSAHLDSQGGLHKVSEQGKAPLAEAPATTAAATPGPGWVTFARWEEFPSPVVARFSGSWTVPEPPADIKEQILFLHIGIQGTSAGKTVFAPAVLQWGKTPFGGGEYWGIACWAQIGKNLAKSDFVRVEPGDTVHAQSVRTMVNDTELWRITATASSGRAALKFTLEDPLASLQFFGGVLEAYALDMQCSQYPASPSVTFRELAVDTDQGPVPPLWQAINEVQDCGQRTEIVSETETEIFFRGPQ